MSTGREIGLREGCEAVVDTHEEIGSWNDGDRGKKIGRRGGLAMKPVYIFVQDLTDFPKIRVNTPVCSCGGMQNSQHCGNSSPNSDE